MDKSLFSEKINQSILVKKRLINQFKKLDETVLKIISSLNNGGKILFCGNGGSAADAQHLATELIVRLRPAVSRNALPSMSLALDTSYLTACGNDFSFNKVFSRAIEGLGKKEDVLIAISTSGNSQNIVNALKAAKKKKIFSIALLGNGGGKCKNFSDISILVDSKITAHIQESHIFLGHCILEAVENKILNKNY